MLIAGNWKMNKTASETAEFCSSLKRRVDGLAGRVDISVFPPYTSLAAAVTGVADSEIAVGAQNVHWEGEGAFTGEISAPMLRELGVYAVIVGHSERRQYFGETDETVGRRAAAALEAGLFVIACVGERLEDREAGKMDEVLRRQVSVLSEDDRLVIAYEPVWAIGTGVTATPDQVRNAHEFIKGLIDVPLLYGGSVTPGNCTDLLILDAVDGALVGGASLDLETFAAICEIAATHS
jgi:triosephosphate isomerase (TIM)